MSSREDILSMEKKSIKISLSTVYTVFTLTLVPSIASISTFLTLRAHAYQYTNVK